MIRELVLAVGLAAIGASAARQAAPVPPGCFHVTFTDWTPGGEGKAFYEPLPTSLLLRDTGASSPGDSNRVGYRSPLGPEGTARVMWRRLRGDTIAIMLPRGWSAGLALRVVRKNSADTLVGTVEDYADYSPRSTLRGHVRLLRTDCR